MRAIEHHRYVVRATNSGVSALIDPAGRLLAQSPLLAPATLRGTVHVLEGATPYARLGDWPGWAAAAAVLGLAARRPRRAAAASA
jgi:apolipoprotein N-acyltransferase